MNHSDLQLLHLLYKSISDYLDSHCNVTAGHCLLYVRVPSGTKFLKIKYNFKAKFVGIYVI